MPAQVHKIGPRYTVPNMPASMSREEMRNLAAAMNRTADLDDEMDATRAQQEQEA